MEAVDDVAADVALLKQQYGSITSANTVPLPSPRTVRTQ